MNQTSEQERIIKKFEIMSQKHHKLSLLFYELSQSLRIESKRMNIKEFKDHIKSLNLDINKIRKLSSSVSDISLEDMKK